MKEKRLRRSVSVALFHPCSRQQRLAFLESRGGDGVSSQKGIEQVTSDTLTATNVSVEADQADSGEGGEITVDQNGSLGEHECKDAGETDDCAGHLNPYRSALVALLTCGNDRFTMLGCLLIDSCIRPDISSCSNFFKTASPSGEDTAAAGSVLEVLETLRIWDVDDSSRIQHPDIDMEVMLAGLQVAESSPPPSVVDNTRTEVDRDGVAQALEAEWKASPSQDANSGEKDRWSESIDDDGGEGDVGKKDYKAEMDEYTYGSAETAQGATRGRGGSVDLEDCQQAGALHADAMAICALKALADHAASSEAVLPIGSHSRDGIMTALFYVLNNATTYSLAVLQVNIVISKALFLIVVIIDIYCVDYSDSNIRHVSTLSPCHEQHPGMEVPC